ncbi:MAG: hypothetical protein WCH34_06100 [Bacteroidota bacterium]
MKKITSFVAIVFFALVMSSCGTIFGGKISACQKHKPLAGEPKRQIRPWVLVADIVLAETAIPIIVDFVTGGIYKPCDTPVKPKK